MTNNEQKCERRNFLKLYNISEHTLLEIKPYENVKTYESAMASIRCFVDNLCETFHKKSLSSYLNEFQCEMVGILGEDDINASVFGDKNTIPIYFINLFLKDLNMVLEVE